jgi:flagellar motility protein MotE (MotC chaperone)
MVRLFRFFKHGGLRIRLLPVAIFCGSVVLTIKLGHLWHLFYHSVISEHSSSFISESAFTPAEAHAQTVQSPKNQTAQSPQNQTAQSPQDQTAQSPTETTASSTSSSTATEPSATISPKTETTALSETTHHADTPTNNDKGNAVTHPLTAKTNNLSSEATPSLSVADIDTTTLTPEQYKTLEELQHNKSQLNKDLPTKEATLKAIEQKIDEKIKKLEDTKSHLEALVKNIDEKDKNNLERLVKMAESMNPEDAAKILETLELPILMDLMEVIKPAKGAAILAVMEAPKAGYLMNELAKRKKLVKLQDANTAPK